MKSGFFSKKWHLYLLLFLLSFGIYFFYYQHLILNLNSVLFQAEGDSIKNYYTYAYHVANDSRLLHFSGMNYPFGEHVVYSDCQPLISGILRLLPFTADYAIGILHGLMMLSFIITPLILLRIFTRLNVSPWPAFFSSLAIAILSPQMQRMGGHFALAYGCVIPLGILFLLSYFRQPALKRVMVLFIYSLCLFFVHPYFGLGISAFCFLTITLRELFSYDKTIFLTRLATAGFIGAAPIIFFKLFMALTDTHHNRPTEPYGVDIMAAAANFESVFTPSFGPFTHFLKSMIKAKQVEWEAHSYVGICSMFLLLIALLGLPFYIKKVRIQKELLAMFAAAVLFLLFAFGLHVKILALLHLQIDTLNQFRAFGRFAWYFYFLLPVLIITLASALSSRFRQPMLAKLFVAGIAFLLLCFNMLEGHYMLSDMSENSFQARNIFNKRLLTTEEKNILASIKEKDPAAILPFPVFHIGSEMYQRNGDASVKPAMLYSFHAGLPLLSVMMSRTSLNETETALELLNRYKRNRPIETQMAGKLLLVIKTGDNLMPDEQRVLKTMVPLKTIGDNAFFTATIKDFILSEPDKRLFATVPDHSDTANNILFIPFENKPPFTDTRINDYAVIATLDSNRFAGGNYILSFHYHLSEKKFRFIHNNSIVTKTNATYNNWEYFNSVRSSSGFYNGFIVFEQKISIDPHYSYEFMLNGATKEFYRISNFMIRPDTLDIQMRIGGKTLYNNYPD